MAKNINSVNELRQYLECVLQRADHHAQDVAAVALTLAGAVLWRHDPGSIVARTYREEYANVLTFSIREQSYAFAYSHETLSIELRIGGVKGKMLESFGHSSSAIEIFQIFLGL